jgi:hypothetical protein
MQVVVVVVNLALIEILSLLTQHYFLHINTSLLLDFLQRTASEEANEEPKEPRPKNLKNHIEELNKEPHLKNLKNCV